MIKRSCQVSYHEDEAVPMKMSCVQVSLVPYANQVPIHLAPHVKHQALVISKHSSVNGCGGERGTQFVIFDKDLK